MVTERALAIRTNALRLTLVGPSLDVADVRRGNVPDGRKPVLGHVRFDPGDLDPLSKGFVIQFQNVPSSCLISSTL